MTVLHGGNDYSPRSRIADTFGTALVTAIGMSVIFWVLAVSPGCGHLPFRLPGFLDPGAGPAAPCPPADALSDFARSCAWMARWLALFSVLAVVASFHPVAAVFVPRKAAAAGFVIALCLAFVGSWLAAYGKVASVLLLVGLVVAGGLALWPYLVVARKGLEKRRTKKLRAVA